MLDLVRVHSQQRQKTLTPNHFYGRHFKANVVFFNDVDRVNLISWFMTLEMHFAAPINAQLQSGRPTSNDGWDYSFGQERQLVAAGVPNESALAANMAFGSRGPNVPRAIMPPPMPPQPTYSRISMPRDISGDEAVERGTPPGGVKFPGEVDTPAQSRSRSRDD